MRAHRVRECSRLLLYDCWPALMIITDGQSSTPPICATVRLALCSKGTDENWFPQIMVLKSRTSYLGEYIGHPYSLMLRCGASSGTSFALLPQHRLRMWSPIRAVFYILISGISVFYHFSASSFVSSCEYPFMFGCIAWTDEECDRYQPAHLLCPLRRVQVLVQDQDGERVSLRYRVPL